MRQSPLFSGILYFFLGMLFTYFAIQNVSQFGWGFFSYLLVILATFDFGAGLRMIGLHLRLKKSEKK